MVVVVVGGDKCDAQCTAVSLGYNNKETSGLMLDHPTSKLRLPRPIKYGNQGCNNINRHIEPENTLPPLDVLLTRLTLPLTSTEPYFHKMHLPERLPGGVATMGARAVRVHK